MTPASIQFVIGVLDVALRLLGLLMALGMVFLFSLHRFAARTAKQSLSEPNLPLQPDFPKPAPFILRSTRNTARDRQPRAA